MILISGVSGFIGFHLANSIKNKKIIGVDSLENYYDLKLKKERLKILKKKKNFKFIKLDLKQKSDLEKIFKKYKFSIVINLAAQPGVRVSFKNPYLTLSQNIFSFINIIELSRKYKIKKFIYASSSSVYGNTKTMPFIESDKNINPVSVYGSSKLTNEIIANAYASNFKLKSIGLRFFTVYGPYGRPDMAYFKFMKKNQNNQKIEIYNNGNMFRDFTYIDDIIKGINKIIEERKIKQKHTILNLGKGKPDKLIDMIKYLELFSDRKFDKKFVNNYPHGDLKKTFSSTNKIKSLLGWKPKIPLKIGIEKFIQWFKNYY